MKVNYNNKDGKIMKEKLFLVDKSIPYSIEQLKKKSLAELTTIADYVLNSLNSLANIVSEGFINLSDYHLIPKQVQEDEYHVQMGKQDDWTDIVINNELQLHVSTNGGECYNIDLYAYVTNVPDDDRDWDNEFIAATHASYSELKEIIDTREND